MDKYFILSNGLKVANIGLGTYQLPDDESTSELIRQAIQAGYRHIDCSPSYYNAKAISEGIFTSGIDRKEICISTKARNRERGREKTYQGALDRMKDLNIDYIDMYLLHWPASVKDYDNWKEVNRDTWQGMIDLYKDGIARSIGVCNFLPHHLDCIMDMEIQPMVNQIEFHPGFMQKEAYEYCLKNNIVVEAHTPLGGSRNTGNEELKKMAEKYGKNEGQLYLRWELQKGTIPLPKSTKIERVISNFDVYDFEISDEDVKYLDEMECFVTNNQHPDSVEF
ncbi:MAG: aldo/keto reductase [Erysipelotrichaceae bacterium]|nr:aldo/keto reductase [Erysipelotrichaceae bacterium]